MSEIDITAQWPKDWPGKTFPELVQMYISDCHEYLTGRPFPEDGADVQDIIYSELRTLKDECMKVAGKEPLPWKDNIPGIGGDHE